MRQNTIGSLGEETLSVWHKYIPNVQVFLVVNNFTYMIEIVYLWLKSDPRVTIVLNPQIYMWKFDAEYVFVWPYGSC